MFALFKAGNYNKVSDEKKTLRYNSHSDWQQDIDMLVGNNQDEVCWTLNANPSVDLDSNGDDRARSSYGKVIKATSP